MRDAQNFLYVFYADRWESEVTSWEKATGFCEGGHPFLEIKRLRLHKGTVAGSGEERAAYLGSDKPTLVQCLWNSDVGVVRPT